MTEEIRLAYIIGLDDELLQGGAILSEWCSYIIREADTAFIKGAFLAAVLTALAGVETYLRSEYRSKKHETFVELIDTANINKNLKNELNKLRKYRNRWVHIDKPWNDKKILQNPDKIDTELEKMAYNAIRALRETIYENQWV